MKAKINGTTVEILKDENGEIFLRVHGMEYKARVLYFNHETQDIESMTFTYEDKTEMESAIADFRKSLHKSDKVCQIDRAKTPYYKRIELTHHLVELIHLSQT